MLSGVGATKGPGPTYKKAEQQALASLLETWDHNARNPPSAGERGQPQIGQVPSRTMVNICEL